MQNTIRRLTKANIDKLPKADGRYEVTDDKLPGFKLRVGRTKRTFIIRYAIGKTKRTFTIGDYGPWTPEQARQEAAKLLQMVDQGLDPALTKQKQKQVPTFKKLAEEYLQHANKRSLKDDIGKLEHVLLPRWGTRQLTAITSKDVTQVLTYLNNEGRTPATRNRYLALIKVMFQRAIDWGYLDKNPAAGFKPERENNKREYFLAQPEVDRLWQALNTLPVNAANAIKLCLATGQRAGNVLAAMWKDIDLATAVWSIPLTKSGKAHTVFLSDLALEILAEQQTLVGAAPYVFSGRHGRPHIVTVQQTWERARALAGLPSDLRLHDLRHTFASLALISGASLYEVQKLLGHSSPQMTQRYSHIAEQRLKQLANNVVNLKDYQKKAG